MNTCNVGDSARHETTQVSPAIAVSANTPRYPATPDCRHVRPRFGEPASDVFCDQHFRRITLFENTKCWVCLYKTISRSLHQQQINVRHYKYMLLKLRYCSNILKTD